MSAGDVAVAVPAAPVIPAGTAVHPGPSVRESTIAVTAAYGPKAGAHVSAAELMAQQQQQQAAAAAAAAKLSAAAVAADPHALRPSIRESTIDMTEKHGPKAGNHIPASELPKSQTLLPQVDRPSRYPAGPLEKPSPSTAVKESSVAAPAESIAPAAVSAVAVAAAAVADAPVAEAVAAVVEPPMPAAPELVLRDAEGRLPSIRESTIAMTEKYGPKQGSHVPPGELQKPAATRVAVEGAGGQMVPSVKARQQQQQPGGRQHAVAVPAAKDAQRVGGSALLAKPVREWRTQDVKQAAAQVMENKMVMTALAVGAAALTVFSVYKGVTMYNHYRLGQSIAEVEREKPTVVHLYIHRRSPLAPSVSIPCTRVETLLRLAHVPYEAHVISDPTVSPNGELPFVVFAGQRIAGADAITDAMERELEVSLDHDLSREDRATGVALLSALRYSLARGYMRSVHVDRPDVMQPYYSEMNRTPDWFTRFALRRMQRRIADVNETSGYSQLSSEQYVHELWRDVHAIEALLEHHTFLFSSDYPCSYDCALYAWLLPVVAMEDAAEVNAAFAYIVESELITNYVRRMTEMAFPDLDELVYGQLEASAAEEGEREGSERQQHPEEQQQQQQQPPMSEDDHLSTVSRRSRTRPSESLRRSAEAATAAAAADDNAEDEEGSMRPSQREVRLPGEH